ncbi:MAG: HNH endonuclease signature motif containing protein [Candidatus Eremiobacteraeota bacterium]|nr:HNH endonuclease signature motif containing protein [Candidatus Eremiobacteraeota bacterium]
MDTFDLCHVHSCLLPDEEELLHLADSFSSQDYEDLLLLPEPYELPGGTLYKPEHMVKITREGLIPEAERLTEDISFGSIDRDERASRIDFTLCEAARGRLALDLVLGGLLVTLKTKGVDQVGYRSMGTFATEHLSFSGRTASELMHNFELLRALPLTREAYLEGRIAKSALRHLSRVATPENEAEWLAIASGRSLCGLEREVRRALTEGMADGAPGFEEILCDAGGPVPGRGGKNPAAQGAPAPGAMDSAADGACDDAHSDGDEGTMMYFSVPPSLALTWDFALSFFRDKEHYDGPMAGFVEALLANYLASRKAAPQLPALDAEGNRPIFSRVPLLKRRRGNRRVSDPDEVVGQAFGGLSFGSPWEQLWSIHFPSWLEEAGPGGEDAGVSTRAIAGRLIRAASIRQRLDVAAGMLLRAMDARQLQRLLGYEFIEDYAGERCGFSMAQTRQLIKLAEGFHRHSLTEDAFRKGVITREQARLILPLVDSRNESQWIAYAASVPTADLREEAGRVARILEYDCLVPHNYTLLPGFRYLTDERFHDLPEEVQILIRSGSWYTGLSLNPSWPLESDDEELIASRDRRFDAPWKHFSDVDEMRASEAAMKIEKDSRLCASLENQSGSDPLYVGACNGEEQASHGQGCQNPMCSCHQSLEKALEACTIPHGESPGEVFLRDVISSRDSSRAVKGAMSIKFFLPRELYEVWNLAAHAFLARLAQAEWPDSLGLPEEKFLAALLADYLVTEGSLKKAARHHKILKRDRFRCQTPGCRCRRNLHVHHIIRRSQGGTDDPWNLITLCEACHLHLLHGLRTLTVRGRAPFDLTFTFGSLSDGGPFLVYERGVKQRGPCFIPPGDRQAECAI